MNNGGRLYGRKAGKKTAWYLDVLFLERKVRWITISTAAVVILSITAVMLIAGYGMKGFGDLLMGNSRSLAFWSAMDAESSSFQYYAGDRSPENREKYELSCARTRSALKSPAL